MNAIAQKRDSDADAFAHTLALIESAFRLARPDARQWAEKERSRYLLTAIGLAKRASALRAPEEVRFTRADEFEQKAAFHQDRADAIEAIVKRYKTRVLYQQDRGMLAEQHAQPNRRDPILSLVEQGKLGHEHQLAAQQIAQCYEAICRAIMPKTGDMERFMAPPKGSRKLFQDIGMSPYLWDLYNTVYLPWTREMHARRNFAQPQNLPLVIDVVVDGLSVRDVRIRQRPMPTWNDTFATLKRGLELWGEIAG